MEPGVRLYRGYRVFQGDTEAIWILGLCYIGAIGSPLGAIGDLGSLRGL